MYVLLVILMGYHLTSRGYLYTQNIKSNKWDIYERRKEEMQRKDKKIIILLLVCVLMLLFVGCSRDNKAGSDKIKSSETENGEINNRETNSVENDNETGDGNNVLIVYFSHSGNTEKLSGMIALLSNFFLIYHLIFSLILLLFSVLKNK